MKPSVEGYRHYRVPRRVRERQILDVAEQVFNELGFQGGSIEEVTRRAGIKRPLIYTYFGGKDGLYIACYRRARQELNERLGAAAATVDNGAPDALHQLVERVGRAYFDFLAGSPGRWDMLYGPGAATAGPIADEIANLRFQTVEMLATMIRPHATPGVADRELLAFAHSVSGSGEQLARWWRRAPELTIDELSSTFTKFAWSGLSQLRDPG